MHQRPHLGDVGLFIGGQWTQAGDRSPVLDKFTGVQLGTTLAATADDVTRAVDAARKAAAVLAALPAHRRYDILMRTSQLLREQREDFARIIAAEAGKALKFARAEVDRGISTFSFAAEEARRIHGETVPLDAIPAGEYHVGFYTRRPVGVVAAITPFNFPLNLVAHKVAPAIAAGNAVILKPAATTPLTAVMLCRVMHDAGLPPGGLNLLTGSGSDIGTPLAAHPHVDKVTFTGSQPVGEAIIKAAGIKKVTLELGNSSPVIIAADADLEEVSRRVAVSAFYNAGQVCISSQRLYSDRRIHEPLAEHLVRETQAMVVGDPLDERVDVGPMITVKEAQRIEDWVDQAVNAGAVILTGGSRADATYQPTLLDRVTADMKIVADEAFGPVAGLIACDDFEHALHHANDTRFGLQAAVFTRDIDRVFQAVRHLNFGGVIINDTPSFRADHMPYGGTRQSGLGREGLRYAIEEMTHIQMIAVRLSPPATDASF